MVSVGGGHGWRRRYPALSADREGQIRYTAIVTDPDGGSRFEHRILEAPESDLVAGVPPFGVTDPQAADRILFFEFPAGWTSDFHPAPRRQFYVQLTGEVEISTTEGEVRRFRPGDVVLAEDTTGTGHTLVVAGPAPATAAIVQLEE
jgi:quercetin dioxygenase-like cupin family protein